MDYWRLKMKIFGSPRAVDDNDALWGFERDRYFSYLNRDRVEAGFNPIPNDEDQNPNLAVFREFMYREHEVRELREIGIEPADPLTESGDFLADDLADD